MAGWRGPSLDSRSLRELQSAAKMRAAGWDLPGRLPGDYLLRVHDVRLEPDWLDGLMQEVHGSVTAARRVVVGGDFLTRPGLEDAEALDPKRLQRWGPTGDGSYLLVVPPRPHLERWLERSKQQLWVEASAALCSVLCVVPRAECTLVRGLAELRRLLPQAALLFDNPSLGVSVVAVGERPPLRRIPSAVRKLPPPEWDRARLDASKVLVVISFWRCAAERPAVNFRWVRGEPPPVAESSLELLRVEFDGPAAARRDTMERTLRGGLRKVAEAMGLAAPTLQHLRQVQVQADGRVVAVMGVPRVVARSWLGGSGCAGVFIRPLWTDATAVDLQRDCFRLMWLRGKRTEAAKIWVALRGQQWFVVDG